MGTKVAHDVIGVERIVHFQGERSIFAMILAPGGVHMDPHGDLVAPTSVDHPLLDERMLDHMDHLVQTFGVHPVLLLPITTTTMTSGIAREVQILDVTEDTEGDLEPF